MRSDPWRYLDHTADLGLEVRGRSLNELFVNTARAIFATMVRGPVIGGRAVSIRLRAETREDLLLDWCRELLYRFSVKNFVPGSYDVRINGLKLAARLKGVRFDPDRHAVKMEIKNATYHRLRIVESSKGFKATIVFDV
jgi:SHS2 domain-containing protein